MVNNVQVFLLQNETIWTLKLSWKVRSLGLPIVNCLFKNHKMVNNVQVFLLQHEKNMDVKNILESEIIKSPYCESMQLVACHKEGLRLLFSGDQSTEHESVLVTVNSLQPAGGTAHLLAEHSPTKSVFSATNHGPSSGR